MKTKGKDRVFKSMGEISQAYSLSTVQGAADVEDDPTRFGKRLAEESMQLARRILAKAK
jgi:hypothetical protein